jgi:hypothetical protein
MATVDGMLSLRDQLRDSNLDQAKQNLAKVRHIFECILYTFMCLNFCMKASMYLCTLIILMIMVIKLFE